jgi:spore coat protein U-like protein
MSSRAWSNVPIGLIAGAGLLLAAGPVAAQVQSETLTVQARIGELCTVTSASLDFGPGVDIDANNDADGLIEISCVASTEVDVELDGGLNFNGDSGTRKMAGEQGGTGLQYLLYQDPNRLTLWNPGEAVPADIVDGEGSVTVYGRVPAQTNNQSPGLHTDEVTITLVF